MLNQPIAISSFASISPLGRGEDQIWSSYLSKESKINYNKFLSADIEEIDLKEIKKLSIESRKYRNLDQTVLFTIFAARRAYSKSGWDNKSQIGINIGSSRGATQLFEKYHKNYLLENEISALTSPTTTLGNISSWLAHDLQIQGPTISHSITCSTALHAVLNGIAWINSGMVSKFIVGGSEAANTPFTISQMQALKIYAKKEDQFPCRSLDLEKKENTMVLGEGAAVFCLEPKSNKAYEALITGIGYATEVISHNTSISVNADCFQSSMKMALDGFDKKSIDVVVMHAPGTMLGDQSEFNAIKAVFGNQHPAITTNKWKIGHALGASGGFSLELAILMLKHQKLIESPFYNNKTEVKEIRNVLVNAVGFGGNATSIIVSM